MELKIKSIPDLRHKSLGGCYTVFERFENISVSFYAKIWITEK